MPVPVTCPNCGASLKAPDNAVGRKVKCPKCGGVISVSAAQEEPIDLGKLGVQVEAAAAVPPPPPPRQRRQDDYAEDDRPRSRRRREDDYDRDDDYDDDRPSRREGSATQGGGLPMGLGIASLSVGVLGLLIAWIPCVGALSWPICAIGLILGVVGLMVGISKGNAIGFPIAGSAVSGVALAISLMWVLLFARAARDLNQFGNQFGNQFAKEFERAAKDMQKQAQEAQAKQFELAKKMQGGAGVPAGIPGAGVPGAPPTPPTGAIALAKGKGQLDSELTLADPRDRMRNASHCKVFTVTMSAGRTYQIDMIKKAVPGKASDLDPYLRLEDPEGNNIAQDDDGGDDLNARITFMCTRAGIYRIVATTLNPATGQFTLKVEER
jgi:predicted Zn finger-like uncharacterized protein